MKRALKLMQRLGLYRALANTPPKLIPYVFYGGQVCGPINVFALWAARNCLVFLSLPGVVLLEYDRCLLVLNIGTTTLFNTSSMYRRAFKFPWIVIKSNFSVDLFGPLHHHTSLKAIYFKHACIAITFTRTPVDAYSTISHLKCKARLIAEHNRTPLCTCPVLVIMASSWALYTVDWVRYFIVENG